MRREPRESRPPNLLEAVIKIAKTGKTLYNREGNSAFLSHGGKRAFRLLLIWERGVWREMDIRVGDRLQMKKKHPCGSFEFVVLRAGMDIKIQCTGCGRVVELPRSKCEKNIKKLFPLPREEGPQGGS